MIHLAVFVLVIAALAKFTRGWLRGILLTVFILGAIFMLLA
jgi:hypothetical protein